MRTAFLLALATIAILGIPNANAAQPRHICTTTEFRNTAILRSAQAAACLDNGVLGGYPSVLACGGSAGTGACCVLNEGGGGITCTSLTDGGITHFPPPQIWLEHERQKAALSHGD